MKNDFKNIETKVIHSGESDPMICGAVSMPVFQSATFAYSGQSSYHGLNYIRLNNTPNHTALHQKLAAMENAESALVTASGMAAISTALLSFLSAGDHMIAQDCLYGGTHDLITKDFQEIGITCDFVSDDPDTWSTCLQPNTKLIYCEAMTNPLLQIIDLNAIVKFARNNNLVSIIDNTFPSPVNFRPAEWGFDLSLHSCTKYLNGHSDIVAGAVIGKKTLVERVTHKLNHTGGCLDPHTCFLLHRGIKTLSVRMKQHNQSAMKIANFLDSHEKVKKVNYPGLLKNPYHHFADTFFDGFSGMLSFELTGDVQDADEFIEKVVIPISAPSLGGVETLITRPAITSHAGVSAEDRNAQGISDQLIRLSVGIESTEDLINDLKQALNQ